MDRPAQPTIPAKKIPIQYGAEPNTIMFRGEDGVEQTIKLPTGSLPAAALNNMEYEDNNGVKRSIYLPQGTVHAAWDHLENERWDELAKFAPFPDQGYTDDDFKKFREYQERKYQDQGSSNVDSKPEIAK